MTAFHGPRRIAIAGVGVSIALRVVLGSRGYRARGVYTGRGGTAVDGSASWAGFTILFGLLAFGLLCCVAHSRPGPRDARPPGVRGAAVLGGAAFL